MSLATFKERWPENVDGRYYVHSSCTDCAACTDIASTLFARFQDGYAYVVRQPMTADEERSAQQALRECPTDAIADDGTAFDPQKFPATAYVTGGKSRSEDEANLMNSPNHFPQPTPATGAADKDVRPF